jgi:peptide/nickel transport system substrate-binding protein
VGSPEVDNLLAQASVETDKQKAIGLYNQADALIWKEGHSVELYQTPSIIAVRPELANVGAFGLKSDDQYADTGLVK